MLIDVRCAEAGGVDPNDGLVYLHECKSKCKPRNVVSARSTPVLEGQLSSIIRVAGIDPSLANWGMAKMRLDAETLDLELEDVTTICTEPRKGKTVRQNSDDLRRAGELYSGFQAWMRDCTLAFVEVPSGSQHQRSALGFGVAIGVLASSTVQLIEVMPVETKLASVGSKTADKPEIIAWAAATYPNIRWNTYHKDVTSKGKMTRRAGDLHADNEHAADACAVVHAGIQTSQFKQLLALWKSSARHLS
jgi:Holliday junction resolvasome RuvABC endonuclease subunit